MVITSTFLRGFRPVELWLGKYMYRNEIRANIRTLSEQEDITIADIRGDIADEC
jgi:hypothetical protein